MDFVIYILSIWALVGGANFAVVNLELLTFRFNMPKSITPWLIYKLFGLLLSPEDYKISIMGQILYRRTYHLQ